MGHPIRAQSPVLGEASARGNRAFDEVESIFVMPGVQIRNSKHTVAVAGGIFGLDCDFYKFVRNRNLTKNEGIVLRHLLRLVILAGEFLELADQDPDYQLIGEQATRACMQVDPRYTDRFLAEESAKKAIPL